ncbi:peptide transporter family 1-like isoform X2 [Melanaphis sacchari]|uniref:peptide transporter family 1-like isoform X2 n=1 Tax=Melanaphis sacchari TaxID=742174 RepID=UPI000DC148E1|nr:peptide transporter family 1-like isoform X2 [Melanaphis sacchari]
MDLISDQNEKLKYPKSLWFIVLNEFCERFTYYGLRTVLVLYLTTILKFNGEDSTIIYHSFIFFAFFMPLFGAILADSYWGKFKTIICLSVVYVLGSIVLTGASMADMFSLNIQKTFTLLGLFFISMGTGGIKPCIFTFGGDQFQLPQQEKQLLRFTTKFIIAINIGSLISTFLTPELRQSVHCFGKDTCFPLAFGVPAILMLTAIAIFLCGKNMYVKKIPEHNVIARTFGCIFYALRTKITSRVPCQNHWLENAKGVYTETEISDTKSALKVITVFVSFPIFWSLYEQQGSRWTLQATLLNGYVDFLDWTIKPDQMQTLVPLFGLAFLVLFDIALYPLLTMIGIRKPLQKLTLGGVLAVVAFLLAALLQFKIFGNTTEIPPGQGRLNIYNGFDCKVFVRSRTLHLQSYIDPLDMINVTHAVMSRNDVFITLEFEPECSFVPENFEFDTTVTIIEGEESSYHLVYLNTNTIKLNQVGIPEHLVKEKFGNPNLRILIDYTFNFDDNITLTSVDKNSFTSYPLSLFRGMNFNAVKVGKYNLVYNGKLLSIPPMDIIPATFYTLTIQRNGDKMDVRLFTEHEGNYIHILWQLPQYVCMIIADVIFVVTTTEFSFTEAPINMKSFISAISLFTTALGNFLVVIISSISIKNQVHEYLLYSGLMLVDTLLLAYFSVVYQNKNTNITDVMTKTENKKEEITVFD